MRRKRPAAPAPVPVSVLLQQEANRQGFALALRTRPGDDPVTSTALDTPRGSFQVSTYDGRTFQVSLWVPGALIGDGGADDLPSLVRTMRDWQDGRPLRELQQAWRAFPLLRTAFGHEEGHAVEDAWQNLLLIRRADHWHDPDLIAAAAAQPRLRALFPRLDIKPLPGLLDYPCRSLLQFHRVTRAPWPPIDTPFVGLGLGGGYFVHAPDYTPLGRTVTPAEAVAVLLTHLPADCGPAHEGQRP
ncbi:DUF6193 family natural product biosynthesis protein [Kitasatospora sp. NPDC088134]|uniref:DUF6193 family natural product biosynthesis protein n=1 Tax=Kitasatospora sp. NPDC088134 TaxID=3364071 RepID=UPI0038247FA5